MKMAIFSRCYDLVNWLLIASNHFPRSQRFVVTKRLLDAAFDFQELLLEANGCRGAERVRKLRQSDVTLDKVRLYLRLAHGNKWLSDGSTGTLPQWWPKSGDCLAVGFEV